MGLGEEKCVFRESYVVAFFVASIYLYKREGERKRERGEVRKEDALSSGPSGTEARKI